MKTKPPQEFHSLQAHGFTRSPLAVILVAEVNPLLVQVGDAVVGYSHFVGVPSEACPVAERTGYSTTALGPWKGALA